MQSSEKEGEIWALNGARTVWRQLRLEDSAELAEPGVPPPRVTAELSAVKNCLCSHPWDGVVVHGLVVCEFCVGNQSENGVGIWSHFVFCCSVTEEWQSFLSYEVIPVSHL